MQLVIVALFAAGLLVSAFAQHAVCLICGCSTCPDGFLVNNPTGIIPVPLDFQAEIGFTELQCGLLERAGLLGEIPPEFCTDDFRMLLELRRNCDCPPVPVDPPLITNVPIAMQTSLPAPARTITPVLVTAGPTNFPTITPVAIASAVPTNFPTLTPVAVVTAVPTNVPTITPVAAVIAAPTIVPTITPVAVVTAAPTNVPTRSKVLPTEPYPIDAPSSHKTKEKIEKFEYGKTESTGERQERENESMKGMDQGADKKGKKEKGYKEEKKDSKKKKEKEGKRERKGEKKTEKEASKEEASESNEKEKKEKGKEKDSPRVKTKVRVKSS